MTMIMGKKYDFQLLPPPRLSLNHRPDSNLSILTAFAFETSHEVVCLERPVHDAIPKRIPAIRHALGYNQRIYKKTSR